MTAVYIASTSRSRTSCASQHGRTQTTGRDQRQNGHHRVGGGPRARGRQRDRSALPRGTDADWPSDGTRFDFSASLVAGAPDYGLTARRRAAILAAMPSRYPTPRRRHRFPKPDRRRALELLAGCGPEGCAEAVLKAHGFTTDQLAEVVRAGLATATSQDVRAGRERMEVAVLRITDAGRQVLAGMK
jgi:hypothetical protein